MPQLSTEQRNVVRRSLRVARQMKASPRETKALLEALAVESGYRELNYGDRDSVGALQQRPSQGWGPASESLETDVKQFLSRAKKANKGGSAGQLAQAVQRSAFPSRYGQHGAEAEQLLQRYSGSSAGASRSAPGTTTTTPEYQTIPAVDRSGERLSARLGYLEERGKPGSLLALKDELEAAQDVPERTVKVGETTTTIPGQSSRSGSSGSRGGSGIKELFWNGPGAVNIKNGKSVQKGFVSGHTDHVHVAAGPKTAVRLGKIAQKKFGLTVSENPAFDKVDPVHAPKSWHYSNRAIDVSGDPRKMAAFARYVARYQRAR